MGEVVVDLVDMHQHMGQILIHDDCQKPFQLHGTRQKVINSDLKLAIARGASLSFHFHVGLGQVPSPPDPLPLSTLVWLKWATFVWLKRAYLLLDFFFMAVDERTTARPPLGLNPFFLIRSTSSREFYFAGDAHCIRGKLYSLKNYEPGIYCTHGNEGNATLSFLPPFFLR